jgi:hypothetical protein
MSYACTGALHRRVCCVVCVRVCKSVWKPDEIKKIFISLANVKCRRGIRRKGAEEGKREVKVKGEG